MTIEYAGLSLLFGLMFGSILAAFKLQKNKVLKYFGVVYTAIFRSVPPVVLLFLVYYGLPQLLLNLFGIDIQNEEKILYVIITISILSMVSLSEVIRSAYISIDKGQYEAAISTGLLPVQAMIRIV
ncbi:MAG: ABC transporter permease subunit, partial [Butyrivibrio sp.]|nr:ABC transporter permease subunit [Butyrivibrio sp.]